MSAVQPNWVLVLLCLAAVGVGALMWRYAAPFGRLCRDYQSSFGFPKDEGPYIGMARFVAVMWMIMGIVGAVMGLFFADKMERTGPAYPEVAQSVTSTTTGA